MELRQSFKRPISLLEQILEGLPCIHGTGLRRRGRFLLHPHTHRVEGAIVTCIFFGDACGYRLAALESARRIKIRALFAGVQLEATLWTFADRLRHRRQQCAALKRNATPRAGRASAAAAVRKCCPFWRLGRELSRGAFLFLRYGPGIRAGDIFYRTRGLRSQLIGAIRVYSNQMSTISRIGRLRRVKRILS